MDVGEMQRKLSLWATQDKGHRFYDLYHLLYDETWLRLAHDHVAQNAGSTTAGCDGINMRQFDEQLEENLQRLAVELKAETFAPHPVRRVYIRKEKPDGRIKLRPLGIPAIRDRIVQEALRMILEPIYEADFSNYSFGFRPNRSTIGALSYITRVTNERTKLFWVIEGDISSYFDTINHKKLLKLLRYRVRDEKILRLLTNFLQAGVMEGKLFKDTKTGTPQGGIISPLLANIYLHELDRYMEENHLRLPVKTRKQRRKQGLGSCLYVRYADDFVVLCNGPKSQVETLKEELYTFLKEHLRLELSKEKTKITHLNDGVAFLGYKLWRKRGQKGMSTRLFVPDQACRKFLDQMSETFSRDTVNDSARTHILAANRIIAGWCHYYKYASDASRVFNWLGWFVHWKMAHWLGAKYRLRHMSGVMKTFHDGKRFAVNDCAFISPAEFHSQRYRGYYWKPNPYLMEEVTIQREDLPKETEWVGYEQRKGMTDLRPLVLERDGFTCQKCQRTVTYSTAQVDHIRPMRRFRRPVEANRLDNLQTLCDQCHSHKTEIDRQMESPVQ